MGIDYLETKEFSAGQLEELFLSVGWDSGKYPDKLVRAMRRSSHVISAWDNGRLVGLLRSLDDGETVAFLHYLLVHPAYQGRHIGAGLMERMLCKYTDMLHIKIMPSDPKTIPFYQKFGFRQYENYTAMEIMRL
ncbi:MAG TPA: GNAT family N-acetyltransferase [Candidatus Aphodoplasma excrementigallinarum]|uniref:GNAT family N-acetyltransferase n=1 Tax=Candidatus Aphodoplasma excrementigallinarum TaxID=2840673 RepID=A0A9D1NHX3_9FIRM|nr:GNAT family N-acetyltransferase [Candidatus Aphodoplasma excrementigallinarum]